MAKPNKYMTVDEKLHKAFKMSNKPISKLQEAMKSKVFKDIQKGYKSAILSIGKLALKNNEKPKKK